MRVAGGGVCVQSPDPSAAEGVCAPPLFLTHPICPPHLTAPETVIKETYRPHP